MNMNMVPNMPPQAWSWPNDSWWATNAGNGWDNGAALWSAWGWNPMYDMYSVPMEAAHHPAYAHAAQQQPPPQPYAQPVDSEPAKKKPRLEAPLPATTATPNTPTATTSPTSTSTTTATPSGIPTTTAGVPPTHTTNPASSSTTSETDPNLDEMQQAYQYMEQQDDSKAKPNPFNPPSFVAKLIEKGTQKNNKKGTNRFRS